MTIKEIVFNTQQKLDIQDAKIETRSGKPRALLVDFEISASGKVINGRIYPPSGQRNTDSWTKPYRKPVILNHDSSGDPIGRFASARWIDTEKEALDFLGGNIAALAEIKRAYVNSAADPKNLYKVLDKYGALTDRWPGLGKVLGQLRITDSDAIDKFLDERYLTGSAGQSTDALTCLNCGAHWHKGDMCDHQMGGKDEDGKPVVFLCGNMGGKEYSIVNHPAHDSSFVLGISVADNKDDGVTITVSDSLESTQKPSIHLENEMNLKDLESLEISTVLAHLADETHLKEFTDALAGETEYEISWLVRVHDALHSQYDYQIKYADGSTMPRAVYALHGAIHETSMDKDFRDSLINGPLDHYDSEGKESSEYEYAQDSKVEFAMSDDMKQKLFDEFKTKLGVTDGLDGETKEKEEEVQEEDQKLLEDFVDDLDIDWDTLDLALDALVGDAKLSSEKRESLSKGSFCGPNRSFPVPDCAHVTAARRLIGRAKLSSDQKSRVLSCVARKAKTMGCDSSDSQNDCNCDKPCQSCAAKDAKYDEIKQDYSQALLSNEKLKDQLTTVLKRASVIIRPDVDITDEKLDILLDWATKMEDNQVEVKPALNLKPVENPSVSSQKHEASDSQLTNFQKQVVNTYKVKLKERGKQLADQYLMANARYLPSDFKITDYVDTTKE